MATLRDRTQGVAAVSARTRKGGREGGRDRLARRHILVHSVQTLIYQLTRTALGFVALALLGPSRDRRSELMGEAESKATWLAVMSDRPRFK